MGQDSGSVSVENLADEIRTIYRSDRSNAESLIEQYLEQRLKEYPLAQRLPIIEKLFHQFKTKTRPDLDLDQQEFSELLSFILGEKIPLENFSSREITEKLAYSLNSIFEMLNQIIGGIRANLLGEKGELETIRTRIGSILKDESGFESLHGYLDQIQEAFLVAHRAFQQAATVKIGQILDELDPDRIASLTRGNFKIGPLRKAENFEVFKEKFYTCRKWYDSGRMKEELLREFEKVCQKLYKMETRRLK